MDEVYSRTSIREKILNDLKNVVKQIYHESVNNELSHENKAYICLTLIKNLDEALRHGLKQLHLGYWKPICEIIHPQSLQSVENLPVHNETECDGLIKGKAWIALSLTDDSFANYIQCFVTEGCLEKFYEDWSILRSNDAYNHFLSVLSGLDNVKFTFEVKFLNKPPNFCNLGIKTITNGEKKIGTLQLNESKNSLDLATSSSSLTSPVDSGVHIQDSTSDMEQLLDDKEIDIDFLNGNVSEPVLRRKHKKNTKRHVSFHEDIIYKSPEKCRKLKWDSENLRYSWNGEQIDSSILKETDFSGIKISDSKNSPQVKGFDINDRGAPEGEETPSETEQLKQTKKAQKSIVVKRFLNSIKNQTKFNHSCKKYRSTNSNSRNMNIDFNLVAEINEEIKKEIECKPKISISKNEVLLNISMVKEMIRNQTIYKSYKLKNYLFIITSNNVYFINKNLEMKRLHFKNLRQIVVYPDSHSFSIYESDNEFHIFVTGDEELTNEMLGRLEFSMRRNQFDPPHFTFLNHEYFSFVIKSLVQKLAVDKKEDLVYCGAIYLDKDNDLLNSVLPSTKRGFLMYRYLEAGEGWIPGEFCLKNGILYLFGDDTKLPKLAINISTGCQSCNRTKNPDRPHTFQITLMEKELENCLKSNFLDENHYNKSKSLKADSKKLMHRIRQRVNKILTFGGSKESCCVLEFAAANDYELSEWLQMIIQASCGDVCEEAHKEDLSEGMLWVTSNSLTITNEVWTLNTEVDIKSCAQLRDVATFRIGECEKDFFIVIEFICMEASSTSGDWILYLNSREELTRLISILQNLWKFNIKFPCSELREGKLMNRCKKSQNNLSYNCWTLLLQ